MVKEPVESIMPTTIVDVDGIPDSGGLLLCGFRDGPFAQPALVNGAAGVVVAPGGQPFSVMGFTVRCGKIVEIYVLADPARLRHLDLAVLDA